MTLQSKSLDQQVYPDSMSQKLLNDMLNVLDHIQADFVSRKEYNNYQDNNLIQPVLGKEDELGKYYKIIVPKDICFGEVLFYINLLNNKFNIKNTEKYKKLIYQIKIYIGVLSRKYIKNHGEQKGKKKLQNHLNKLKHKYNISDKLVNEIENTHLKATDFTKNQLRSILSQRKDKENNVKLGKAKQDIQNTENQLTDVLNQELDFSFLRKGLETIKYGMETITKAKYQELKEYCEENNFDKNILGDGRICYTKGDEEITLKPLQDSLDKKAQKLKDKLAIEDWKKKLQEAKDSGNTNKINEITYKVTKHILQTLYEYPYIMNANHNGYQPSQIVRTKEVYCVGFSILGHVFLSELGISHKGLHMPNHSALQISIGGKDYLFDPTSFKDLHEIKYLEKCGRPLEGKYEIKYNGKISSIQKGDPEKIILTQIYNNKGKTLSNLGEDQKAIEFYDKAIALDPNFGDLYLNKWNSLFDLGEYKKNIELYGKISEEFSPLLATLLIPYKIYEKIKKLLNLG